MILKKNTAIIHQSSTEKINKKIFVVLQLYLGEHRLAVLGDHGGLVAVEADHGLVEGFLGVPQLPVEVSHSALEYTAEEPGYQCPADSCNGNGVNQREKLNF